jgi:SM-20-related protein
MTMAPPYLVVRDFLDQETVAGLLDYALRHETDFAPTSLGRGTINPAKRISVGIRELGPLKPAFKSKMLERLPDFIAWLHATAVADAKLEFELVAHGDGAFYKRHIDTQTAADLQSIRFLSAVYYFHAEPKAFTGGALRLYAVGSAAAEHVDIEPACNTLVVFRRGFRTRSCRCVVRRNVFPIRALPSMAGFTDRGRAARPARTRRDIALQLRLTTSCIAICDSKARTSAAIAARSAS